jgi:hypothetical protein
VDSLRANKTIEFVTPEGTTIRSQQEAKVYLVIQLKIVDFTRIAEI